MLRLFLLTGITALAQTPSIDQSLSMQSVSNARLSPNGQYVAYSVTLANWEENEFVQQLWISVVATGDRRTPRASPAGNIHNQFHRRASALLTIRFSCPGGENHWAAFGINRPKVAL